LKATVWVIFLSNLLPTSGQEVVPLGKVEQLRVDMTAREARTLVGRPVTMARQVFYQGYLEQWIYERPESFRLDVLYRHGEVPKVMAIHRAQPPRP
jgi:hypothetical protein